MELLPLIIIIPLRIISPLLDVLQKIPIWRKNSQSALITPGHVEDFNLFDSV